MPFIILCLRKEEQSLKQRFDGVVSGQKRRTRLLREVKPFTFHFQANSNFLIDHRPLTTCFTMLPPLQFWFARASEVSIREQLVTQVILGILSDDLSPGQRLPSTRDLARRFHLHPNTISAGYRQLERDKWVEFATAEASTFGRAGWNCPQRPRSPLTR